MKTIAKYAKYLFLMVMIFQLSSCETEEESSDDENSSSFSGVWVRTLGASGDETDLAIGVIEGASTRVFMCEKEGSTVAGFYKGNLLNNRIIWDDVHGLPETSLRMVDSQLEFSYPSVPGSLPTLYNSGSWSGECGNLTISNTGGSQSSTMGTAAFWIQSDLGCGYITLVLNGISATISGYYAGNPGCNSDGSANFELPGGTYNYSASCTNYTWDGTITITNGQCSTIQLTL